MCQPSLLQVANSSAALPGQRQHDQQQHPQPAAVQAVVSAFQQCQDAKQRYQLVLRYADQLPPFPPELKRYENRVMGCSAQVCTVLCWHRPELLHDVFHVLPC